MIGTLDGPRNGRSTGPAGRTAGGFAASRSMKPFGAASAAPRRCCLTTAKPGAGNEGGAKLFEFGKVLLFWNVGFWGGGGAQSGRSQKQRRRLFTPYSDNG